MANIVDVKIPKIPLFKGASTRLLAKHHNIFINKALQSSATVARQVTPVGATALLKGTIGTRSMVGNNANVVGQVVWAQSYAAFVDQGTPPHFPPIAPLLRWARRKLGNERAAYAVQAAIGERGTAAQNFVATTEAKVSPTIARLYVDQIRRYSRELIGLS